jgi:hypothetical protein
MDRSVDAAPSGKRAVCSIDDCVGLLVCDRAMDEIEHEHSPLLLPYTIDVCRNALAER